jgi:hypothetical protein
MAVIFLKDDPTEKPADKLYRLICERGLMRPVREFKFHPKRKWRFDLAWTDRKIAVEIEGGVYTRGRHVRPIGFINDIEKYNAAVMLNWKLFRVTPQMIESGSALSLIIEALK